MSPRSEVVAVIGAGVVGCAVALALAREGRKVLLLDRAEPGMGGASFGNVGHIATELVEPLASPGLLFGFWKELSAFGGPLEIPLRRLGAFTPWALRFAGAAFRKEENTRHLAPLVKAGAATMDRWLRDIGREDLIKRNGHYEIWLDANGHERARTAAAAMRAVGVPTQPAPPAVLEAARAQAKAATAAGLWYPECAHVVDPLEVVRAFLAAAGERGATFRKAEVRSIHSRGDEVEVLTSEGGIPAGMAVVCAGAWSAPLLTPFGLRVPLEAANGYHVEMPGHAPIADAPILFSNEKVVATPMAGRIRATSFMDFTGVGATPDPRKPAALRRKLRALGFDCPEEGPSWMGSRPVLPDYLPGLGQVATQPVYYAIGHQHIGLTLSTVTADMVAGLIAGRVPRSQLAPFDLRRFW